MPGAGSSRVPEILDRRLLDDVVVTSEAESILECRRLLREENVLAGGSSGSVSSAVRRYFTAHPPRRPPRVVALFPDRGEKYARTIYDDAWVLEHFPELASDVPEPTVWLMEDARVESAS